MSYETRGGKQYYYQVRRVEGRLVKTYLGTGPAAEQAAAEVACRRQARAERRAQNLDFDRRIVPALGALNEFWEVSERILHLALRAANYHCRKGEWRRRRERK